jgi:cytochrome c oxidase subunit II
MKKCHAIAAAISFIILINSSCFAAELSGKIENGVRVIEVKASRYKFEPDPIVVKLGEKVRIMVTTADVEHGFAISEYKVNLDISPGETRTAEFTADKAGEFTEYCTVFCGPGHMGMRGRFIVIKQAL